ncbi:binding protein [Plasmodium ovale wallikeri]|uniref:Binding protein n=2 Tax=Plasmodium ovale TaxID=36330 RepID=A0A1A8YT63_PLAOA|nr:binding protein [Plasmodium ovale wallikeri]SBT34835.1 binding protein [Plasmodium ovale wallikeri]SBT76802.1 E3 ubiquitin-protein ligase, putative [Plasmodium ovale]
MTITDEYDLDMYKNIVMSNNCKEENLVCIFNSSSFLNTLCFFLFFIMFLWAMAIVSRYYTSYNIIKYLRNRKAIYMKNLSRYINDIKMLCRSHVNDIIRIKKKITPKNVEKVYLSISINNNIQLYKNYLSSSSSDISNFYKYTISFSFSSKRSVYIRLYWGVLLHEVNEIIHEKTQLGKNISNGANTVICIDNFKNLFKDGFGKNIPSKRSYDATQFLLNKDKKDFYTHMDEHLMIDFNTAFYKTPNSFYTGGTNVTYTMPYDEHFCVSDILNRIEIEKINSADEEKDKEKKDDMDFIESKIITNTGNEEHIRIPLIIVLNDIPSNDDEYYTGKVTLGKDDNSNDYSWGGKKNKTKNGNTLIVLVDFKKVKEKYKPFVIKDICVLNEYISYPVQKYKKKGKDTFQFIDIMDIYGHEEHDKECLICMTSYKDTLLMPCRHSSFCYDCMKSLRQEKCPICRCLFTSFIKFPLKNVDRGDT